MLNEFANILKAIDAFKQLAESAVGSKDVQDLENAISSVMVLIGDIEALFKLL